MTTSEGLLSSDRERLVDTLVHHQRMDSQVCLCGWAELGASHAEHVSDIYIEAIRQARPEIVPPADQLYEKCDGCHFFIEPDAYAHDSPWVHLTRGTEVDDLMTCDEARPSGRKANLLTWKTYGPLAMRERFTS